MRTIEISDTAYEELMSRRLGREAISKTLIRELKPVKKSAAVEELEKLRKEPRSKISSLKKD